MNTTILNIDAYLTEASKAILAKKRDTTLFDHNLRIYRDEFGELEDFQYERVGVLCQTFGFLIEHVGKLKEDEIEESEKLVATIINELSHRDLLYEGINQVAELEKESAALAKADTLTEVIEENTRQLTRKEKRKQWFKNAKKDITAVALGTVAAAEAAYIIYISVELRP